MTITKRHVVRNASVLLAVTAMAIAPISAKKADSRRDLVGARGARAEDVLRERGLRVVDSYDSGRKIHSIWNSLRGRECVEMTVSNDRVEGINDVRGHPRCRW